jgi:hypothetical protein
LTILAQEVANKQEEIINAESIISPAVPITTDNQPVIIKRFEGVLDDVRDKTPIDQDSAYNYLLHYVSRISSDEISTKVKSKITYNDLMQTADKYRGELIRARGVLLYLNPYRLITSTAGVDIYYEGMIGNPLTDEFYRFHLIDKPQEPLKNLVDHRSFADEVEIEGTFLKIAEYKTIYKIQDKPDDKSIRYAPFIIGRKMTKIIHLPPKSTTTFQWTIGIITGIVLIAIFIYIAIVSRKEPQTSIYLARSRPPFPNKDNK